MGKSLKGKELGKGIRQRYNGLYDARAIINGQEIHISNTNLKILKHEFNALKKETSNGNTLVVKKYTLNEWFEQWFETYKIIQIKKSSVIPLKSKFRNIFGCLGNKNVQDILNIDIQNVINNYVSSGKNLNSLKSALSNLSECFSIAIANKIVKENPCLAVSVPRNNNQRKSQELTFLTKEEENEFLKAAQYQRGSLYGNWLYEAFYTLFYTGMRVSELCGLKWKDVNFRKKYISIERQLICQYCKGKHMYFDTPKTQAGYRKIPFIGDMENILKQQYKKISERKLQLGEKWQATEEEFSDLVFYSIKGTPLIKDTIAIATKNIVNRINKDRIEYDKFKPVHPHMFRHSFAVKCYEHNIDLKTTQMLLGHSNFNTTMNIYTHISDNKLESEIIKFDVK